MTVRIITGDVRERLRDLPDESVHCVVTSPPYYGLRDYGTSGQIGLEPTPDAYVAELVAVFRELRRVLRKDGTAWLNLGDTFCSTAPGTMGAPLSRRGIFAGVSERRTQASAKPRPPTPIGLKPKDLIGIPWRVAFALQEDGWWLRRDIVWAKPNPMPESVSDRCTSAHEYVFHLSKSERYWFDAKAIAEPVSVPDWDNGSRVYGGKNKAGANAAHARTTGRVAERKGRGGKNAFRGQGHFRAGETGPANRVGRDMRDVGAGDTRNRRSVWTIATKPFPEAHFATMPPDLAELCILAGCPEGGTVLDPFGGAGTTGLVADRLKRNAILIELNQSYAEMAEQRLRRDAGFFAQVVAE